MSLFDLAGGLVIVVSVLVGWIRGASREVATVAALIVAAVVALFALRFTGPIARHAIHTPWLANIAAILIVFAGVYILLRVVASAITRRIHQTAGLGGVDRTVGAGFGLARALVVLGLVNLTVSAIIPPERMPAWISGAFLYPLSAVSADGLKAFAPQGASLARKVAPVVGHALAGQDNSADNAAVAAPNDPTQNRDTNGAPQRLRVERSP